MCLILELFSSLNAGLRFSFYPIYTIAIKAYSSQRYQKISAINFASLISLTLYLRTLAVSAVSWGSDYRSHIFPPLLSHEKIFDNTRQKCPCPDQNCYQPAKELLTHCFSWEVWYYQESIGSHRKNYNRPVVVQRYYEVWLHILFIAAGLPAKRLSSPPRASSPISFHYSISLIPPLLIYCFSSHCRKSHEFHLA